MTSSFSPLSNNDLQPQFWWEMQFFKNIILTNVILYSLEIEVCLYSHIHKPISRCTVKMYFKASTVFLFITEMTVLQSIIRYWHPVTDLIHSVWRSMLFKPHMSIPATDEACEWHWWMEPCWIQFEVHSHICSARNAYCQTALSLSNSGQITWYGYDETDEKVISSFTL